MSARPNPGPEEVGRVAEALALGRRLCVACDGYHRIWGGLRAAGVVGATAVDEPALLPALRRARPDARSALVAGAADAALVELLVRAFPDRRLAILVVDRCPAPLALIARRAEALPADVETREADLERFEPRAPVDLVLSHSQIGFSPTRETRLATLARLLRALRPGGTLALVARVSTGLPATPEEEAAHARAWVVRARGMIQRAGVAGLYAPGELDALLDGFARGRAARSAIGSAQELLALVAEAGFEEPRAIALGRSTRLDWGAASHLKTSVLFLARRP